MYRLTPAQQTIVAEAASLAEARIAPCAADVDERGRFPSEAIAALGKAGFMGLTIPAEFGGREQSLRVAAAVVDEIAQRCASTAMVYMMHLCGVACYLASREKMAAYLRSAAEGRHLSTLAFSEKGSRSQFWAPVGRPVSSDSGRLTLSAEKSWVTSAGVADGMAVSCLAAPADGMNPGDVTVFLALKSDPGVSVSGEWNALGMRGNQSAPVLFADFPLDIDARAFAPNGQGQSVMLGAALPVFQICQGAIGVGLAEAAFKATQGHLTNQRFTHTNLALADLPNLRARLAEMRIETDKARAYLSAVLSRVENADADATLHVLAVKASSAETAVRVTDLAMRSCGGAAFSRHLGLERVFRDARAAIVMAPTTDHLHEFIGRALVGLPLFG
jgi:alkylation response protein AidB-like acyl-CoA dehydrogenase